nr:MAG TPA: hypothetical protein [Bacteriophage sp.]
MISQYFLHHSMHFFIILKWLKDCICTLRL